MGKSPKSGGARPPRNEELVGGVMRFSRARMYQKKGLMFKKPFKVRNSQHIIYINRSSTSGLQVSSQYIYTYRRFYDTRSSLGLFSVVVTSQSIYTEL